MSFGLLRSLVSRFGQHYVHECREVEMAGFNTGLELGRIARAAEVIQSKKLMRGIKGIYSLSEFCQHANLIGDRIRALAANVTRSPVRRERLQNKQ